MKNLFYVGLGHGHSGIDAENNTKSKIYTSVGPNLIQL